jgi:integrase
LYVYLILYSGIRRGEAWALTRKDIKLKERELHISKTAYVDNGVQIGTPKSKAGNRVIPIPDELYRVLKEYLQSCKEMYIFTKDGHIFTECQINKLWTRFIFLYNKSKGGVNSKDKKKMIRAIAPDITPHIFDILCD